MNNSEITSLQFPGYNKEVLIVPSDYVKVTFSPTGNRFTLKVPAKLQDDDKALTLIAQYASFVFEKYKGTEIFGTQTYRSGARKIKAIEQILENK